VDVVFRDEFAAELYAAHGIAVLVQPRRPDTDAHEAGVMTVIAPDTPLLAGTPLVNANSPEKSYMPQEDISDRQLCTVAGEKTGSSVRGQTPRSASDAAPNGQHLRVELD
jgi:hypothetical protein